MSALSPIEAQVQADEGYDQFEEYVRLRVAEAIGPLFETNADKDLLWAAYLEGIPADRRQHYNCHCCRRFIQAYAGLVTIDENGHTIPVLFDVDVRGVPEFFRASATRLYAAVRPAKVTGVFLSADADWGTRKTGSWTHLSGVPRPSLVCKGTKLLTPDQMAAERKQDFEIVQRSIEDFPIQVVDQVIEALRSESVPNGEVCLGTAKWFRVLLGALVHVPNQSVRNNLVWRAVATAAPGYAHFRSGMLSTLLDDVAKGLPFAQVKKNWVHKMNPLKYRRAQVAPSGGQIDAAEKMVEKLEIGPSFRRRFAKLEEVQYKVWTPPLVPPSAGTKTGFFGHLRPTPPVAPDPLALPPQKMTLEKFQRTVLPSALEVFFKVPTGRAQFYGLTTAVHPDAPPIFQWDGLDGYPRNPVSWYVYDKGSWAKGWGLTAGAWAKVTAVFDAPFKWHRPDLFKHQLDRTFFALEGAKDSAVAELALFMSLMKAELNPMRAVIEAHSKSGKVEGSEDGTANGFVYVKGSETPAHFWVRQPAASIEVHIDRWD